MEVRPGTLRAKQTSILMLTLWYDEVEGGWTYFREIARKLSKAGYRVLVVSPHARGRPRVELDSGAIVYRCTSWSFPNVPLILVDPIDFVRTLMRIWASNGDFDLVYDATSGLLPFLLPMVVIMRLRGKRTPIVLHVFGRLEMFQSSPFRRHLFGAYLQVVTRLSLRLADRILLAGATISKTTKRLGAPSEKTKVVRVGLKHERLWPTPPSLPPGGRNDLRKSMGIGEDDFVLGYVGRLVEGKGLEVLLKSIPLIVKKAPESRVILVGEGSIKGDLEKLSLRLGVRDRTDFVGHSEDVVRYLQATDVFVNLSETEADISATQLEAMSLSLPSVVTAFSTLFEDEVDALVVSRDPQEVADAVLRLRNDPILREKIGRNAGVRAVKISGLYTWESYLAGVGECFVSLLSPVQ